MTAVEPTTPTNAPTTGHRSRRDVLCGLLVAIVAPGAVVTACSSGGDSSGTSTGTTPTDTGTSAGSGSSSGLAALADVPDGGGVVLDNPSGGKILVVRTGDEVKAYNAACTHMGTTVAAPADGVSTCPAHGSEFATSDGSVKKGPATTALATINVAVEGDQIVLA